VNRRSFGVLGGAALLAGCRSRPSPFGKVRVFVSPRFTVAPIYLADELGLFRSQGLELDILEGPESAQSLPLLVSGKLDVSLAPVTPALFNAIAKGARVRVVACREALVPGCVVGGAVYGRRSVFPQGLEDLRKLRGKHVAVTGPASLTAFWLDTLLESAGMSVNDVRVLYLRLAESAAALAGGKIDAAVFGPLDKNSDYAAADIVKSRSAAEMLPGFQYTFVLYGKSLLDEDPSSGTAFLDAFLGGVEAFLSGRTPRAFDRLAQALRADPAAARGACRDQFSTSGAVDPSSIQRLLDWATRRGFLSVPLKASEVIEPRFFQEVARRRAAGASGARK